MYVHRFQVAQSESVDSWTLYNTRPFYRKKTDDNRLDFIRIVISVIPGTQSFSYKYHNSIIVPCCYRKEAAVASLCRKVAMCGFSQKIVTSLKFVYRTAFPDLDLYHMVATLLSILATFAKMADKSKERTFIMVKPDGVQRGLVGEIMKRFESRGYKLVACKMCRVSKICKISPLFDKQILFSKTPVHVLI